MRVGLVGGEKIMVHSQRDVHHRGGLELPDTTISKPFSSLTYLSTGTYVTPTFETTVSQADPKDSHGL